MRPWATSTVAHIATSPSQRGWARQLPPAARCRYRRASRASVPSEPPCRRSGAVRDGNLAERTPPMTRRRPRPADGRARRPSRPIPPASAQTTTRCGGPGALKELAAGRPGRRRHPLVPGATSPVSCPRRRRAAVSRRRSPVRSSRIWVTLSPAIPARRSQGVVGFGDQPAQRRRPRFRMASSAQLVGGGVVDRFCGDQRVEVRFVEFRLQTRLGTHCGARASPTRADPQPKALPAIYPKGQPTPRIPPRLGRRGPGTFPPRPGATAHRRRHCVWPGLWYVVGNRREESHDGSESAGLHEPSDLLGSAAV